MSLLGPIGAYDVDEKLVNTTCLKYYKKFWDKYVKKSNNSSKFSKNAKNNGKGIDNQAIELESTNWVKTRNSPV